MNDEEVAPAKVQMVAILRLAIVGCDSLIKETTNDEEAIYLSKIRMKLKKELDILEIY